MKRQYESEDGHTDQDSVMSERHIAQPKRIKQRHNVDNTAATFSKPRETANAETNIQVQQENVQPDSQASVYTGTSLPGPDQLGFRSQLAKFRVTLEFLELESNVERYVALASKVPFQGTMSAENRLLHTCGIIFGDQILEDPNVLSSEGSQFNAFATKVLIAFKNKNYPNAELAEFLIFAMPMILTVAHQILTVSAFPQIDLSFQVFKGLNALIEASCRLFNEFGKLYKYLMGNSTEEKSKLDRVFKHQLYKYSWMLVIFVIGIPKISELTFL